MVQLHKDQFLLRIVYEGDYLIDNKRFIHLLSEITSISNHNRNTLCTGGNVSKEFQRMNLIKNDIKHFVGSASKTELSDIVSAIRQGIIEDIETTFAVRGKMLTFFVSARTEFDVFLFDILTGKDLQKYMENSIFSTK